MTSNVLLNSQNILVIKLFIESMEIGILNNEQFKQFTNFRLPLIHEIAKMTGISYRLIELLKPRQVSNGCNFVFFTNFRI